MTETLKNFMLEHFDFDALKKAGFYGKDIKRKDYQAQAERIRKHFGYKSIYEYGTKEISCHLTYEGERPLLVNGNGNLTPESFVITTKSWLG